jgi:hypothetical protein
MNMGIHKLVVISFFILSITYAAAQNKGSASSADITAEKIWICILHHFFFEDNDNIALPEEIEQSHSLDCDNFALYAYVKFNLQNHSGD